MVTFCTMMSWIWLPRSRTVLMRKPFDVPLMLILARKMLFAPLTASLPTETPCPPLNVAPYTLMFWVAACGIGSAWGSWYCGGNPDLIATSSSPFEILTFMIVTTLDETTSMPSVLGEFDGAVIVMPLIIAWVT